ncbi:MAG: ATP-binding cassette domain-containing protein [Alphaproteobacteria bacterium]|nr:MAG: ATP-binding cassette domain-containing protein [Alphaproteobacteria bacterium]
MGETGSGPVSADHRLARAGRTAWMLAARLPEAGRLRLGDLLRHAGWGMGRDAARFLVFTLLAGLLSLGTPLATGAVMANAIPEADHPLLLTLFLALVAAAAAQAGISLASGLATVRAEGRAGNRVQEAVWDRLLRLPVSFFRRFDVGDLTNRALSVDTIRAMASMHAVTAITHGIFGLFSLALMIWYDVKLGLVVATMGLVFAGLTWLVGRAVLREVSAITDDTGRLEALIFQFVQAITKIRVAGAVVAAFQRFAELYRRLLAASRRQMVAAAVLQGLSTVWPILTFAVLVAVLAFVSGQFFAYFRTPADWAGIEAENLRASISASSFIAFYTALGQFSLALVMVSGAVLQLVAIRPWAERLRPILDTRPEDEAGGGRRPERLRGQIAFHGVCFRYAVPGARILDGVNLRVEPGEMVALVGPSGAGKSTIIRLLLGFEEPEEGSIFIDGIDLKRLDRVWFRRRIGVVLQDGRLLPGSILQNIAAGARISREEAMEAVRMAGMEDDLKQMPMGLETMLSEGAVTLSGGQRQRLMIARALVRRPRLVIFDEATSALDNETQAVVTDSLNRLAVTRLVVAHRLSTIREADRIYVLDRGRVVEEGRFEELLAADGLFRRLAQRQMIAPPAA